MKEIITQKKKQKNTADLFIDAEKTYINMKKPIISHNLSKLFQDIMEKKLNNRFISAGTLIRFRDCCIQEGSKQTIKDVLKLIEKERQENKKQKKLSSEPMVYHWAMIEDYLLIQKIKQLGVGE